MNVKQMAENTVGSLVTAKSQAEQRIEELEETNRKLIPLITQLVLDTQKRDADMERRITALESNNAHISPHL